ncbi:MAG: hypothetical protein QME61_03025 [Patescibacteria group bacterium]|nr:hypothetical protein [Patescibacteria group bacterium]
MVSEIGIPLMPAEIEVLPLELKEIAKKQQRLWERQQERIEILKSYQDKDFEKTLQRIQKYTGEINEELKVITKIAAHLRLFEIKKQGFYSPDDIIEISGALEKVGENSTQSPWKEKIIEIISTIPTKHYYVRELLSVLKDKMRLEEVEAISLLQKAAERIKREWPNWEVFLLRKKLGMPVDTLDFKMGDMFLEERNIKGAYAIYQALGIKEGPRAKIIKLWENAPKGWIKEIFKIAREELGIKIKDC